ncbi:alpha/beta fold hydrolase [Marinicauda algicola]|nr:alpha/beta hydrolase [Marinicauda algicola]
MNHPDMPPARRVKCGEVTLSVHEAGPEDGVPVLLLHGWPELALSWARQIEDLAGAGYRVIAPDNRGFGASDVPHEVEAYGIDHLVGDYTGLLDALGIEKAVWVGHDWGGIAMWHAAALKPERFLGAAGVCTPHLPRGSKPPTEVLEGMAGEEHYIIRFQDEDFDDFWKGREEAFFAFVFMPPPPTGELDKLPASVTHLPRRFERWLERGGLKSEADCVVPAHLRARYAKAYAHTGFRGGFNWYRNLDANWQRMAGVDLRLKMPCKMISAEADFMLPPKLAQFMPVLCSDLDMDVIAEVGHWVQYEAPDQLSAQLIDWLGRRFGKG